MKKILLSLFALLSVLTAAADDLMLTKCNGSYARPGFGARIAYTMGAATHFTAEEMAPYAGAKLKGMRAYLFCWDQEGYDTYLTDLELWVTKGVNDSEKLRAVKVTPPTVSGWVEVTFDEPLEVPADSPLTLGYTYTQSSLDPPAWVITIGDKRVEHGCYLDSGDGRGLTEKTEFEALSVEGYLTDVDLSQYKVQVTAVTLPKVYYEPNKQETATVTWKNMGREFSKMTLTLTVGEKTFTKSNTGTYKFGDSKTVSIPFRWPSDASVDLEVKVAATSVDGEPYAGEPYVVTIGEKTREYERTVLIEEGTGTWCGWCIRGIVAMDQMKTKYPDSFIGIAAHAGDEMAIDGYTDNLNLSGYPSCTVDRLASMSGVQVTPDYFEKYYTTERARKTYADFTLEGYIYEGNIEVGATATFDFNKAGADVRMSYVLTEDDVTGYSQANYYAGGGSGPMGGYENEPSHIDDMTFYDVARAFFPKFGGEKGSLALDVVKGETYTNHETIAVPGNVANRKNLWIVGVMLDGATGEVIQAHKVKLDDRTGIDDRTAVERDSRWHRLDGTAVSGVPMRAGVYVRQGKKVVLK